MNENHNVDEIELKGDDNMPRFVNYVVSTNRVMTAKPNTIKAKRKMSTAEIERRTFFKTHDFHAYRDENGKAVVSVTEKR